MQFGQRAQRLQRRPNHDLRSECKVEDDFDEVVLPAASALLGDYGFVQAARAAPCRLEVRILGVDVDPDCAAEFEEVVLVVTLAVDWLGLGR